MDIKKAIEFLINIKNCEPILDKMDSKEYDKKLDEVIKLLQCGEKKTYKVITGWKRMKY